MLKSENGTMQTPPRLCHVIKKENFDGYGFNLHAEKGKPGQYIGKVDDGSPAESAGLKQGDRILEVNGSSIGSETHKQVVQRIKALANEVQLLVVDSNVSVTSDNRIVEMSPTNGNVPTEIAVENTKTVDSQAVAETKRPPSPKPLLSSDTTDQPEAVAQRPSSPPAPLTSSETPSPTTPVSPTKVASNDLPSPPIEPTISPVPSVTTTNHQNNVSPSHAKEGLNLNMTAAELRAKLAAKKKFDPKTDPVDLRQKFEIIQKL